MQLLEVSGAVRPIYGSLGVKRLKRVQRGIIINAQQVLMYSTRYSCQILIKLKFFSEDFRKKNQISNLMKTRSVGAELFHADCRGRTDMTKLIVAFRYFANAPKK